jgi:diguanylate cyclase (GGDEF)-like protein
MRILIADDDATSRLMLKAIASKLGHDCLTATDGTSAWQTLSTQRIDVLLTDWMMPGLSGPELCGQVRDELTGHYVYIVMITGLGSAEQVLQGMSAGADDYLIKPVDPFTVQTRLVAAERVTLLHRQVSDFRAQLERANLELLGRSLTDPLTGLGNRRRMEEDLAAVHAQSRRDGRPYSIALFDIDHFKLYNDHYGHQTGDEALRRVAHLLDSNTRAAERVYRYGGEEFLLLLPESGLNDAAAAAARICRAVEAAAIPHHARPTTPPIVTVSGGVACQPTGVTLSPPQLIQHADEALFVAKSAGRNQVSTTAHHSNLELAGSQTTP